MLINNTNRTTHHASQEGVHMNLKILSLITTLLILAIAEILSYINLSIWEINTNSPSYSERYYYKKELTTLFQAIEKIRVFFYILFLILVIATIIIYFCF